MHEDPSSLRRWVRRGVSSAIACLTVGSLTLAIAPPSQALIPGPAIIPAVVAATQATAGAGIATGAVVGGGICAGTVVCGVVAVGAAVLLTGGALAWQLTRSPNEPSSLPADGTLWAAPGWTWNAAPYSNTAWLGSTGVGSSNYRLSVTADLTGPIGTYTKLRVTTQYRTWSESYQRWDTSIQTQTFDRSTVPETYERYTSTILTSNAQAYVTAFYVRPFTSSGTAGPVVLAYGGQPSTGDTTQLVQQPNEFAADPPRKMHADGTCRSGATGMTSSALYSESVVYTETGTLPPMPAPMCPLAGTALVRTSVIPMTQNTYGVWIPSAPMFEAEFLPTFSDPTAALSQCLYGSTDCVASVQKVTPEGTVDCTLDPSNAACADQTLILSDQTVADTYQCRYGPYTLPAAQCEYAIPQTTTNPTPQPTTTPSPTATPTTSPSPEPTPSPTPTNTAGTDVPEPSGELAIGCAPTGWAVLNPIAYVQATACVLQWAFVPTDLAPAAATVQQALDNSALGTITTFVSDFTGPLTAFRDAGDNPNNCLGPAVTMPFSLAGNGREDLITHPFAACEGFTKTLAEMSTIIIGGTVYISALYIAAGNILGAFGLEIPLFRRGGEDTPT